MTALAVGEAASQTEFLDDWRPVPAHHAQTRAPLATQSTRLFIDVITDELGTPFGLAVLPDGRLLISELLGAMRIVDDDGNVSAPLEGMPTVWAFTEGGAQGLHDIALHPQFEQNGWVYFAYSAPPAGVTGPPAGPDARDRARRLIGRAQLSADRSRLENAEDVFEVAGRRMAFAPDGTLLITTVAAGGERADAQDMTSLNGKLLRINDDGSIPDDNPFVGRPGVHPAIFANGFRDPSGIAIDPSSGEIWTVEHGPRGGDELNLIVPGGNYGWPAISYGRNYDQTPIGDGLTAMAGMAQPVYFWVPSIAPSSLMFYSGDLFPQWAGNALITTLSGEHLARLERVGNSIAAEERLLVGREQRIRTAAQGPDGAVYLLIAGDDSGQLLRLRPKPPPGRFTD